MNIKTGLKIFAKYSLFGVKPLLALAAGYFKAPSILYFYFLADLGNAFYQGYEDELSQDLSVESLEEQKRGNVKLKKLKENYEKMASVQIEHEIL